eukprot:scaffold3287_cov103-Isochrysis_galbana.AAC.1
MTDPPTDHTEAREPDAPGTNDAKQRAPVHGHTGDRRRAFRQGTLRHTRAQARHANQIQAPCVVVDKPGVHTS